MALFVLGISAVAFLSKSRYNEICRNWNLCSSFGRRLVVFIVCFCTTLEAEILLSYIDPKIPLTSRKEKKRKHKKHLSPNNPRCDIYNTRHVNLLIFSQTVSPQFCFSSLLRQSIFNN